MWSIFNIYTLKAYIKNFERYELDTESDLIFDSKYCP